MDFILDYLIRSALAMVMIAPAGIIWMKVERFFDNDTFDMFPNSFRFNLITNLIFVGAISFMALACPWVLWGTAIVTVTCLIFATGWLQLLFRISDMRTTTEKYIASQSLDQKEGGRLMVLATVGVILLAPIFIGADIIGRLRNREKGILPKCIIEALHIHRWKTVFSDGPKKVQRCSCGKHRSTQYDMCHGGTYWVSGNRWT